jgi:hypothetical protein
MHLKYKLCIETQTLMDFFIKKIRGLIVGENNQKITYGFFTLKSIIF